MYTDWISCGRLFKFCNPRALCIHNNWLILETPWPFIGYWNSFLISEMMFKIFCFSPPSPSIIKKKKNPLGVSLVWGQQMEVKISRLRLLCDYNLIHEIYFPIFILIPSLTLGVEGRLRCLKKRKLPWNCWQLYFRSFIVC